MEENKIYPVSHYLLIKVEEQETTTESGIVIRADDDDKINETGTVIAGGGKTDKKLIGKRIAFKLYNADEVDIDENRCVFIKEKHIIAII